MRLVFTKLETPKKNILVDLGTGTFEEFYLEELEDSETGKYLQIPDTIPANSIRVKVSSSEFENFDMIKEYQITDDEGNILGGGSASGGKVTLYCHFQNEDPAKYYLTQDPIANVGKEQTLISIVGANINTLTVTVTAATEDYSKITTENGSTLTLIRSSSGDITFDCGGSSGSGGNVIFYGYRMMGMEVLTPTLITESTNGKLTLIVNKNIGEPTNLTNVEVIEVDGGSVTIKGNVESGTSYSDILTLSRAEDLDATFYGAASSENCGEVKTKLGIS